jgi:glycyl-tRNA synthetase beta chain
MLAGSEPDFVPTVVAGTRVSSITKGFDGGQVDQALLRETAESELWGAYLLALTKLPTVTRGTGAGVYIEFFRVLSGLRQPIDRFFDKVLVMAEDPKVRNNRLALCWQVNQLFRQLADFTLIVQA